MKITGSSDKFHVIEYDDVLKSHLKIDSDTDEALITLYLKAAGDYIEKYIGYPLLSYQVITVVSARLGMLELIKGAADILTVEERQTDGSWLDVTLEDVTVDDYNTTVYVTASNLTNGTEYRVTSNQTCEAIPDLVRSAAMLLVGEMYEQRENRVSSSVMRDRVNKILDMVILPI